MGRVKDETQPLPSSRKAQFAFVIKEQPSLLFFANMTTAMLCVPLLFVFSWLVVSYAAVSKDAELTGLKCFLSILYPALAAFPATMAMGVGMCGLNSLIKKLVFDVSATYGEYWSLMKKNIKQYLLTYGLIGLFITLSLINFAAYYYLEANAMMKLIAMVVSFVILGLLLIIKPYIDFQAVVFDNSYRLVLLNAFVFSGKRLLLNLGNILIQYGLVALVIFLPGFWRAIPVMLLAAYALVFQSLSSFLICLDTFEKKIPSESIKEIYHKGLEVDE